jgi:hypothetical protein
LVFGRVDLVLFWYTFWLVESASDSDDCFGKAVVIGPAVDVAVAASSAFRARSYPPVLSDLGSCVRMHLKAKTELVVGPPFLYPKGGLFCWNSHLKALSWRRGIPLRIATVAGLHFQVNT